MYPHARRSSASPRAVDDVVQSEGRRYAGCREPCVSCAEDCWLEYPLLRVVPVAPSPVSKLT